MQTLINLVVLSSRISRDYGFCRLDCVHDFVQLFFDKILNQFVGKVLLMGSSEVPVAQKLIHTFFFQNNTWRLACIRSFPIDIRIIVGICGTGQKRIPCQKTKRKLFSSQGLFSNFGSNIKRISELLFPLKSSENHNLSNGYRGNRS